MYLWISIKLVMVRGHRKKLVIRRRIVLAQLERQILQNTN